MWLEFVSAALGAMTLIFGWMITHLWATKPDRTELITRLSRSEEEISRIIKDTRNEIMSAFDKALTDYRFNRDREGQILVAAFNRQIDDQNKMLVNQMSGNRETLQNQISNLAKDIEEIKQMEARRIITAGGKS